jgi:hypothetical protein
LSQTSRAEHNFVILSDHYARRAKMHARFETNKAMSAAVLIPLYLAGCLLWFALMSAIFWLALRGHRPSDDVFPGRPRNSAPSSLCRDCMYGSA